MGVTTADAVRLGRTLEQRPVRDDRLPALGLGVISVVIALLTREVYDDPAILYRYAENLEHGAGWTFNPGVHEANAVTSPLTVIVLAGLLLLGAPLGTASALVFATGTWMSAFYSYRVVADCGRARAGTFTALLLVTAPPLLQLRGMESALALGLLALSMDAAQRRRWTTFGLAMGLATLARPDMIVLGASLTVWSAPRGISWRRVVAAYAAVLAAWLLAMLALGQRPLPSTLAAKIAQERSGLWQGYLDSLVWLPMRSGSATWFALIVCAALVGALRHPERLPRPLLAVLCGAGAVVLVYGVVLRIAGYPWYAALPIYCAVLLAGLGLDALVELAPAGREILGRVTAIAVVLAIIATGLTQFAGMTPERKEYPQVAGWLRRATPADATVAAQEIGFLGLDSHRRMVDYLGLLDPKDDRRLRHGDFVSWIKVKNPDYWVTYQEPRNDAAFAVRDEPWFAASYRQVFTTSHLVVFERVPAVPGAAHP